MIYKSADYRPEDDWNDIEREEERGAYCPPPEEIAAHCAALKATWTDRERMKRSGTRPTPWTAPSVSVRRDSALGQMLRDNG